MPSGFLAADTSFPSLSDMQTGEKINALNDYLYMLLEQLRYTLSNLGESNFNQTELQGIEDRISQPLSARISDAEGNINTLQITADGLAVNIKSVEGNITALQVTTSGIASRVQTAEGNISTLTQNGNALTARVDSAERGLSATLQLTPDGLTVTNAQGQVVSIDGGQIRADTLKLTGSIDIAGKFKVDHDGVVTWTQQNSPVVVQYSTDGIGSWHPTFSISDFFARYSYDGGLTWTNAIRIQGVNGQDGSDAYVPSYIKSTYIDSAKMVSPSIYAGSVYATGEGRLGQPAFYIHDGCSIGSGGSVTLGRQVGYLSYDESGSGSETEAVERVFLTTVNGVALKIQSDGNMSLDASGFIHIGSLLQAYGGIRLNSISYGTTLPSTGAQGQVFFMLA